MPKDDHVEVKGTVAEALGGGQYSVVTESGGTVRARLCGKMKSHNIRVIIGDKVVVSMSPYDTTHGMITYREKLR